MLTPTYDIHATPWHTVEVRRDDSKPPLIYIDTLSAPNPKLRAKSCGTCGVGAGEPCVTGDGTVTNGVHSGRVL